MNFPSLFQSIISFLRRNNPLHDPRPTVSYEGDYESWNYAKDASSGYNDIIIANKAEQSFKEILAGNYKCERDTFLFKEFQYSLPLLLGLNLTQKEVAKINVLDFGGSFASSYFRNLDVLKEFDLQWTVIELSDLVRKARIMTKEFDQLLFLKEEDLDYLISTKAYNFVIFGSCLQFLENPEESASKVIHDSVKTIVVEQTPVKQNGTSKLTVQHVCKPVYESSYPAWHFAEDEIMSWFSEDFDLRYKFNGPHIVNECDGFQSQLEDYVFTRKK